MEDDNFCSGGDCLPEGLPSHIKDGIDHKTGGYGCSEVYAANGVWGVRIEKEPWEDADEWDYFQIKIEAFT